MTVKLNFCQDLFLCFLHECADTWQALEIVKEFIIAAIEPSTSWSLSYKASQKPQPKLTYYFFFFLASLFVS